MLSTLSGFNLFSCEQLYLPHFFFFLPFRVLDLRLHNKVLEHLIKLIFLLCEKIQPTMAGVSCCLAPFTRWKNSSWLSSLNMFCHKMHLFASSSIYHQLETFSDHWLQKKKGRCSQSPYFYAFQMFGKLNSCTN